MVMRARDNLQAIDEGRDHGAAIENLWEKYCFPADIEYCIILYPFILNMQYNIKNLCKN